LRKDELRVIITETFRSPFFQRAIRPDVLVSVGRTLCFRDDLMTSILQSGFVLLSLFRRL